MKVERTVDSKVKESLRPATPAQSGIPIPLVSTSIGLEWWMGAHAWILDAAFLKENEKRNRDPSQQRLGKS